MSGITPFFLSGGNARILLDGHTVAFATNISYRIIVKHTSPRVLGKYEVEDLHPLSYDVFGSMTILRYAKGMAAIVGTKPSDAGDAGSSIASLKNGIGLANQAFSPSQFLKAHMFDIEVQQSTSSMGNNPRGIILPVFRLRDCRIDELTFNLDKAGVGSQTVRFTARFLDDDYADGIGERKSGNEQETI